MSDSEFEEEEFLVYADFKNQLNNNELNNSEATIIKMIGIDGENPIAEINGNIFKGTYDFAMGTNVFFIKDSDETKTDMLFEEKCKEKYKYFDKTDKVINFQRIFVEKKAVGTAEEVHMETENESVEQADTEKEEGVKVNISYEDAIKEFSTPFNQN